MKYIKLFENFNNTYEDIIKYFFELRETKKPITTSDLTFKDVYDKYLAYRDMVEVDDWCETGYDVYDDILNYVKSNIGNKTMSVYRAMYIATDIEGTDFMFSEYKGVGEYWSYKNTTYPMDENDELRELNDILWLNMYGDVSPAVVDWDETFNHAVSDKSDDLEITLNSYGIINVYKAELFDYNGENIIDTYDINNNFPIF